MNIKWIVLAFLIGGSACAAPVTYNFSGDVTTLYTTLSNTIDTTYSMGQTLTAAITYDLSTGGEYTSFGPVTVYTNVLTSFWMDNGTEIVGGAASNGFFSTIQIENTSFGDAIKFEFSIGQGSSLGSPVEGLPLNGLYLNFNAIDDNLFTDTSLPSSINPADFKPAALSFIYFESAGGGSDVYQGVATQAVPEPATAMMLFFGGGIGFVIHRARRWANR